MTAVAMTVAAMAAQMEHEEVLLMTQAIMYVAGIGGMVVFALGMLYAHNRPPKRRR